MFDRSSPLTLYMHIARRAAFLKIFGPAALRDELVQGWTSSGGPGWVLREEPAHGYSTMGGYWPVQEGTRLGDYIVRRKLGWGANSTVWLAQHQRASSRDNSLRALKVLTGVATKHLTGLPDALQRMRIPRSAHPGRAHTVDICDHLFYPFFNKNHLCLAMEPLSENLQTLSARWPGPGGLPSGLVRRVVRQVAQALDFLRTECGVAYTALSPEHIMLSVPPAHVEMLATFEKPAPTWRTTLPPDGVRLALTPSRPLPATLVLGDARDPDTWRHLSARLAPDLCALAHAGKARGAMAPRRSAHLCAPEVCLGAGDGAPADIWSIGCLAFELAMGHPLLSRDIALGDVPRALVAHFGDFPRELVERSTCYGSLFHDDGSLKGSTPKRVPIAELVGRMPPADAGLLIDFLSHVFVLDPSQRPTVRELLGHKWLQP